MKFKDGGFTLLELLVVIVIIGILAAIAVAAFAEYRKSAYDSQTVADLRNAAGGEELYFLENDRYVDCVGQAACEARLDGFTGSGDVNISMFQIPAGFMGVSYEYFTGRAFHPKGAHHDVGTAYLWNSNRGGLQ